MHGDLEEIIYMEEPVYFLEDKSKACLFEKLFVWVKINFKAVVSLV